eukprot:TRINITY_DN2859_c0_g1_i1.p1 TRINITY_DN2859_c0_g1~~TRINITY_DN2859_c0_g1_i1.p1  ORF type:complete len:100 (-),score=6.05 TRINITY_DN2859_c0_g1_i1:56-355(-)
MVAVTQNDDKTTPLSSSVATFIAFIFFGGIPLCANVLTTYSSFLTACIFTALTLFVLGVLQAKILHKSPLKMGFDVVCIGTSATIVAYTIGYLMSEHSV